MAVLVSSAVGLLVAAGVFESPRDVLASVRIHALAEDLRAAAAEFHIDPYLVAGIVDAESSGRVDVISSVGAMGLMQLRPDTAAERARRLGIERFEDSDLIEDPGLNLRLGCAYLRYLFDRFGEDDPRPVLVAYNAGPNKAARWFTEAGGFEPWLAEQNALAPARPGSVRHYFAKVLASAQRYRERGLLEP
ncbi:Soluble lytic murein transglycosylase precursor [Planctomycetes bacterium Pla163]|uniref:Soluble lytic murein transglycosylase n=1 Tax=Rohdeia mirabilis TaxID=2528008 RepID=A0A518D1W9_9BACT|nr:Soluble lytic murein transglycosylase precursor [Planctomycetes bacterium Pla163]